VFEIADRRDGGKCLRQVVSQKAISLGAGVEAYTIIGDER